MTKISHLREWHNYWENILQCAVDGAEHQMVLLNAALSALCNEDSTMVCVACTAWYVIFGQCSLCVRYGMHSVYGAYCMLILCLVCSLCGVRRACVLCANMVCTECAAVCTICAV